jgi:hypothetical protein
MYCFNTVLSFHEIFMAMKIHENFMKTEMAQICVSWAWPVASNVVYVLLFGKSAGGAFRAFAMACEGRLVEACESLCLWGLLGPFLMGCI